MSILKLADNLYISPQLTQSDLKEAAKLGIRSIICNRPDGEADDQPSFEQLKQWLIDTGIDQAVHQPVVAPAINGHDVATFQKLLATLPIPTLAFCRTGTRSSLLWAYHQVQNGMAVSDVITAAKQAGVGLSNFEANLHAVSQNGMS
ncbi:TIGR01244 family sulfur transferase [Neisseria animaloris]|uniref:TIGR01244 family sulfur transferase n=1 Tax=Neisseria animaloris TaxID=326522 RepID=UPI000D2FCD12|nr:TIGR01244 family sulfur transferase [Neisseria animaloris]